MADNSGNNTSYILDSTEIELELGKSTTISIIPSPGADDEVSWSNKYQNNVSIINEEHGKVTVKALAESSYSYITAMVNGQEISPSCKVSVFCVPVESISISTTALSMEAGAANQLSANVYPTNATVKTIKWSSSDEKVASVDQQGTVVAIGSGVAVISAISEGKDSNGQYLSKECVVSVGKFVTNDDLDGYVSIDNIADFADKYAKQYDTTDPSKYSVTLNTYMHDQTSYEVTLTQGTSVNEAKNAQKSTINITHLLLTSISYHKEMYHPGCLELLIETTAPLSSFSGTVSLEYSSLVVASKYYIFEKKKKGTYVTLKAYSVDKFLTIDKFSQAFTGKLLVDEIIEGTLAKYKKNHYFQKFCSHITHLSSSTASSDANPNNLWKYINSNLQHLSIAKKPSTRYKILNGAKTLISNINEEDLKNATDYYEVEPVLPYNVQFEESFHDFLVRVCNRNGEFLYVEDNNLCIGIPEATDNATALTESGYEIEYTEEEESCDYTTISNRTEFPAEYYKPIREKDDDFAKKEDYYIPGAISLNLIKPIVESPHILDAIAPTAMACGGIFGVSELFKKQANDGFKKNFGDYTKDDVYQFVEGDGFGNQFYAEILKNEKLAEQKKLIVTSSTYKHHKLGDTVKVDGNPYVVYQVRGGAKIMDGIIESKEIKRYKEEFEMVLIPYIGTKTDGSTGGTTNSPYPIPLPRKNTIKPSTQRATVSANNDPMRLGRVRVLFDWQDSKDSENASPWINIASPMASKESGFMFLPAAGDAVMVDFVDGNVENPYVVGAFYLENRLPSYHAATQNGPLVKSITSANGHHLTFTDLPGSKFGANLLPFSYFAKFGFLDSLSTTGDDNKLGGGFELADYYGFYSITGSTHERKVSIKSPFGDVSIDAFQGITISAPSGNIKIEGKNVDIIARNNLSITSGTNIANPRFYSHSAAGYDENDKENNSKNVADFFLLKHLLQPVAGAAMKMSVDLSLYRTWFESIFRPIGGTMLIKSHRFMRLEAGKGQTAINSSKGSLKGNSKTETVVNFFKSSFRALGNYAFEEKGNVVPDNVWTTIIERQRQIVDIYSKFYNLWTELKKLESNIISKGGQLCKNTFGEPYSDPPGYFKHYFDLIESFVDSNSYQNHWYTEGLHTKYEGVINLGKEIEDILKDKEGVVQYLPDNCVIKTTCSGWEDKVKNWINRFTLATSTKITPPNNTPFGDLTKDSLEKDCRKQVYEAIRNIWNKQENSALKDLIQIRNINNMGSDTLPATFDEKYLKENITIAHGYDDKNALRLMGVVAGGMGLTGIVDDRSWSKKDTGNILLSAEKGKMYRFGADGSFKTYMPDEANAWCAFIIKMIKGAKLTLPEG